MQIKNDEWIETIQGLEKEIKGFQQTDARTHEVGLALESLAIARFWLGEDKANIVPLEITVDTIKPISNT